MSTGDGWADLARYERGIVRPRVFWDDGQGQSLFITVGTTRENRTGGTQPGRVLPVTGTPYREALETRRFDVGALWQTVAGRSVVTARATLARQWHDHQFGETLERDRHDTNFAEITIRRATGPHTWVGGVAVEHDAYHPTDLPQYVYTFTTPGLFAQDDIDVRPWLALSMSGRLDHHSEYGWFFSPRVSALLRSGDWSTRLSTGTGFFGPTPLTEETEAAGLTRLTVDGPLRAERGRSVSIDLTRTHGPLAYTATVFGSRIVDPVHVDRSTYVMRNLEHPTTNIGLELLGTLRQTPIAVTASYTYVRAREQIGRVTSDVAQTPRHSVGLVAMVENEDGRVGFELYYTGRQRLEANPYRDAGEPYTLVGLLIERRVGRLRLFVNLENLTDVRQQQWDPVLRPDRAVDGRWTVDAWAPLDGRVINGGGKSPVLGFPATRPPGLRCSSSPAGAAPRTPRSRSRGPNAPLRGRGARIVARRSQPAWLLPLRALPGERLARTPIPTGLPQPSSLDARAGVDPEHTSPVPEGRDRVARVHGQSLSVSRPVVSATRRYDAVDGLSHPGPTGQRQAGQRACRQASPTVRHRRR